MGTAHIFGKYDMLCKNKLHLPSTVLFMLYQFMQLHFTSLESNSLHLLAGSHLRF